MEPENRTRRKKAGKEGNMRTIRVTGKGQLKIHPDTTRIIMTLGGLYPDYGMTLKRSSEDTETLKDVLSAFGFGRQDLKTLNFSVDTEYESYEEGHGTRKEYKRRFAGYRFTHMLKVEFDSDNERLGKILYALANCRVSPEFRLSYTVRDPEAAKNELLGKAVSDAAAKAEVLTRAAGVTLKEIQSIDYSWGRIEFETKPLELEMNESAPIAYGGSYDMDIEPDDIEVSDTVTVIWEIA